MIVRMYDIGLIPCTATKNPSGLTPLSLYRGGPFSLMVRHARQRCKRIVIMSAKYGLLEEDARVQYYDTFIGDLSGDALRELRRKICLSFLFPGWQGASVLSYLWNPYWFVFRQAVDEFPGLDLRISRPYKGTPSLVLYKVLSNELESDLARR